MLLCFQPLLHQLCAPLQLQGLGRLLLQVEQFLLPQKVLLREELQLLSVVQWAAAWWVQGRPEGRHRRALHQLGKMRQVITRDNHSWPDWGSLTNW